MTDVGVGDSSAKLVREEDFVRIVRKLLQSKIEEKRRKQMIKPGQDHIHRSGPRLIFH